MHDLEYFHSVALVLKLKNLNTSSTIDANTACQVLIKVVYNWIMFAPLLQAPPGLALSPPADDLDIPSSIVTVLEGYNSMISDTLNGVAQVKFDISSLTGYLDQWRQAHCSEQRPKTSIPGPLQELQSRKEFIHTVSIEALMRVKEFLNLLLKNLDHLETC